MAAEAEAATVGEVVTAGRVAMAAGPAKETAAMAMAQATPLPRLVLRGIRVIPVIVMMRLRAMLRRRQILQPLQVQRIPPM
jgi:hypothetical protein